MINVWIDELAEIVGFFRTPESWTPPDNVYTVPEAEYIVIEIKQVKDREIGNIKVKI